MAPGLKLSLGELAQVRHHSVLAHGMAVQAIRAKGAPGIKVGPAENIWAPKFVHSLWGAKEIHARWTTVNGTRQAFTQHAVAVEQLAAMTFCGMGEIGQRVAPDW